MSTDRRRMVVADVRRHHLSLVVDALRAGGPRSRAEMAQALGLTKTTVSALVGDLIEHGVVVERDVLRSGRIGRPGVAVDLRSDHIGALGLELRVDGVAACIVDLAGTVRTVRRRRADNRRARPATVVGRLRRVALDALAHADALGVRCMGGTLAVPGLVDPSSRSLVVAPNLHRDGVVLTPLSLEIGIDLMVDNEANLAALAELRHGVARDLNTFVHVSGGVGIGGGLVVDRAVVRGAHGFAGELGHVVVDPDGPRCGCGARGCLEAMIGADIAAPTGEVVSALATALRSIVHLLDPQAVVLGGSLAAIDPAACDALARRLRDETLGGHVHPCAVRRSTLGPDAALVGAAATALDAFVADPTLAPVRAQARTA